MANVGQQIQVNTTQSVTPASLPGTTTALSFNETMRFNPSNGTTADAINLIYSATLTFVSSTPQVLNLQSMTAPDGSAVVLARVDSIWIKFKDTTDGHTLLLGYATTTSNAWTSLLSNPGQITMQASTATNDAVFLMTAPNTTGWAVGSSNRLLQLDPGTSAFSIDICITGRNV